MDRSIQSALAKIGTIEILKEDSEVRKRFNSLVNHIRIGSDEMTNLLNNVVENSQDVVVEVLEAKEDAEFLFEYFLKTGMDLWQEITIEENVDSTSARAIDSMARKIIKVAKEEGIL